MSQPMPPMPSGDRAVLVEQVRARVLFVWRHGAQVIVGTVAAQLVARYGLRVDETTRTVAETVLFGMGVTLYGCAQHWLETRTSLDWRGRAARWVGRLMVLGAPGQPAYQVAAPSVVRRIRPPREYPPT